MKKNIYTSAVVILCLLMSCNGIDKESGVKNLLGIWEYSVPDAPYGYQEGTVTFEKVKGKLSGYLMINDYKTELEDIVVEKDNVTFNLNMEGENISFDLTINKKSFSGIVSYSAGELDVIGKMKTKL